MADRNRAGSKQIFLSYDRERAVEAFVVKLKQDLEKEGFTVFLDVRDIPPGIGLSKAERRCQNDLSPP